MNKTVIRILVIILCGILLLGILAMPLSMLAAEPMYFGRTTLDDKERYVYDQLLTGVADCKETVELDKNQQITPEQVSAASLALLSDHPEYFWYCGDYTYTQVNQSYISQVEPGYTLNGKAVIADSSELITARAELAMKINKILSTVTAETEYDKVIHLHDYLLASVEYASGSNDQTAYGALVDGKAVCAGYTRAFQLLLNMAGISCWKVDGTAVNPQGQTEPHSWNVVWLEDKCYYFDPTWNDRDTYISHAYFGLSLDQISKDHTAGTEFAEVLPACGHDNQHYHAVKGGEGNGVGIMNDNTTVATLAKFFAATKNAQGKDVLTCSIWYTGADFSPWLNSNLADLAVALNLEGEYNCEGVHVGNEYTVTITGTVKAPQQETMPQLPSQDTQLGGDLTQLLMIMAAVAGGIVVLIIVLAIALRKKK